MAVEQGTKTEEKVAEEKTDGQVEVVVETDETLTEEDQAYFDGGRDNEPEDPAKRETDEEDKGKGKTEEKPPESEGKLDLDEDGVEEDGKNLGPVPYKRFGQKVAENAELKTQIENERNRFDQILAKLGAPQPKTPEETTEETEEVVIPPYEEDAAEHLRVKQEITDKKLAEADKERAETKDAREYQEKVERFDDAVAVEVEKFKETHEDYTEAFNHLVDSRVKELSTLGLSEQEITNQIIEENRTIAVRAIQQRKNPGEVAYALAVGRGYVKPPKSESGDETQNDAEDKATIEAKAKIANIQKGMEKTVSLGEMPGEGENKKSLDSVLAMSDDEFNKLSPKEVENLLGG